MLLVIGILLRIYIVSICYVIPIEVDPPSGGCKKDNFKLDSSFIK